MNERFTVYVMPAERGGFHATMHGLGGACLGVALNKETRLAAIEEAFNDATRHDFYGAFLGEQVNGPIAIQTDMGFGVGARI